MVLLFILFTNGSARPEKIGQKQTCQMKVEKDLAEAMVGGEVAMAAEAAADMVEEEEEAMVEGGDTEAEAAMGETETAVAATKGTGVRSPSKKDKRST